MRLPIDAELLPFAAFNGCEEGEDLDSIVDDFLRSREKAFSTTKRNIEVAQRKQKELQDCKHIQEELTIGTEVLLENTADKQPEKGEIKPNLAWSIQY